MSDVVGEIEEIRRELNMAVWYLEGELAGAISDWIDESYRRNDADTAAGYVEGELNQLLAEYPMYAAPGLSRGEDGFPPRCRELDCDHATGGGACPVLRDETEMRWRERELDAAGTEREARQVYHRQAVDVGCPLISELLEEWGGDHADFVARGNRLLDRARDAVEGDADLGDDAGDRDEYAAAVPDGGDQDG